MNSIRPFFGALCALLTVFSGGCTRAAATSTSTLHDARGPAARVETVSGVEMKIYEPEHTAGVAMDLAVFLHGDDSVWVHDQEDFGEIQSWPLAKGKLFVSLASPGPDHHSWWSKDYSTVEDRIDYSPKFMEALAWLKAHYNLTDRLYYGGVSGGSTFATNYLLPRYGSQLKGVFALGCGGWVYTKEDGDDPVTTLAGVDPAGKSLRYVYGSDDFLFTGGDIGRSATLYKSNGWDVGQKEVPGESHCLSTVDSEIAKAWDLSGG